MIRLFLISIFLVFLIQIINCKIYTKSELSLTNFNSISSAFFAGEIDNKNFSIDENYTNSDLFEINKGTFIHYSSDDLIEIKIEYPQIIYKNDQTHMDMVNKQLYDGIITEDIKNWQNSRIKIEITYQILLLDDNILSVLFSGYLSPSVSYFDFRQAMTFNLHTKNLLTLSDFISLNEIESLLSKASENEHCTFIPIEDNLNVRNDLKKRFLNKFKSGSESLHKNDFYIGKDKIGLILSMEPLLSEHIIAELKLKDIHKIKIKQSFIGRFIENQPV